MSSLLRDDNYDFSDSSVSTTELLILKYIYTKSYENSALELKLSYYKSYEDSRYVINLLKRTIDYQEPSSDLVRQPVQPVYPDGFYKYLLRICIKAKFDLPRYCSSKPNTLWKYSRKFSVLRAVSAGDYETTLFLLQHGVMIPEENEGMFPISLRDELKKVLSIMAGIKSQNQEMNSLMETNCNPSFVSEDKKRCFELLWSAIPAPFATNDDLLFLESLYIFPLVISYCTMYESNFNDIVSSPKQPRSLKHLSRCVIREKLNDNFKLPDGIYDLDLPDVLHKYLNLLKM